VYSTTTRKLSTVKAKSLTTQKHCVVFSCETYLDEYKTDIKSRARALKRAELYLSRGPLAN
jgi:hypothetical protein